MRKFTDNIRLETYESSRDITMIAFDRTIGRLSTLEMQKATTIAQNDLQGTDFTQGYRLTGIYCNEMSIDDLRLLNTDLTKTASGTLWSRTLNALPQSRWPLSTPSRVGASTVQQWSNETNLFVDLRGP